MANEVAGNRSGEGIREGQIREHLQCRLDCGRGRERCEQARLCCTGGVMQLVIASWQLIEFVAM